MSKEVLLDVRHLTQQFHLTKKIKVKMSDEYISAGSGRNLV